MVTIPAVYRVLASLLLAVGTAGAADQRILGRKLLVKDPTGAEPNRVVVIVGKERPTSMTLNDDPTFSGASLQVVANGATGSTQLFSLGAAGWTATTNGFTYTGPTTGAPVRRVILRRRGETVALLKAVLRGNAGTADLTVTPPNPGDDGGLVLAIGLGDRFCVSFGGAAGGTETQDDAVQWHVKNATAKPGCPTSPSITTTSTSSTTSSTAAATCGASAPACDGDCPAGYHCENVGGSSCFCFTGGTNLCTTCDTPCTGSDVCAPAVETAPPYLTHCGCATPPVCDTDVCGGGCPAGSSCVDTNPPMASCGCFIF